MINLFLFKWFIELFFFNIWWICMVIVFNSLLFDLWLWILLICLKLLILINNMLIIVEMVFVIDKDFFSCVVR